jgi:hypothetical protein
MMVTKYCWYRIRLPYGSLALSDIIGDRPFMQDTSFGFSRIGSPTDTSKFRFFWRDKVVVTRFDGKSNFFYEDVESINFVDCAIVTIEKATFLRIRNPGQNIRDLLNALESLVGLGFTSKLLTFEKSRPTTIFKNVDIAKLIGLKAVGAVIDEDLVACMEFTSKQGIAIEKIKLLDGSRYCIDSTVFELLYKGVRGQAAFTSNGVAKISGQLAPRLVHLIELDLPKLG